MSDRDTIDRIMDFIDSHISEKIMLDDLAGSVNFSNYHLCRLFRKNIGISLMAYVTRRRMQHALRDICLGRRIIDAAVEYGYDTHAGFTKAFRRTYGYPPALYCVHAGIDPISETSGGIIMFPRIIEKKDMTTVVGYKNRYCIQDVRSTGDIPAFWDTIGMEYSKILSKLHHTFTGSVHCEYGICFDVDPEAGRFSYMPGVGADNEDDISRIENDMYRIDLPGGLYAVYTTPLVEISMYVRSIREAWRYILMEWLPDSGYVYDDDRYDFEYYDRRDHHWENKGMVQMDIYLPVLNKKRK